MRSQVYQTVRCPSVRQSVCPISRTQQKSPVFLWIIWQPQSQHLRCLTSRRRSNQITGFDELKTSHNITKKASFAPLFSNGCWLTGCMRPSTKTPCSPVLTVRRCSYKPTTSVLRPVINTGSEPSGIRDSMATGVLQLYHPCLLLSSILLSVAGDGNCLFRRCRTVCTVARTTTFICAYS